jgi:hypothetical protein
MSALVWDQIGSRVYETGISKGVLYIDDGIFGVAWNGLTSIDEEHSDEVEPVYFDGVKFNDILTIGDFSAVLRAFTYPGEFLKYEGTLQDQTGFYVTNQPKSRFGLSYQTKIGDDVLGLESGYKIHILYNLTAVPSTRTYQTMSLDTEPLEFEWIITSIPEEIENFRPTAHVIFDSMVLDPNLLRDIEEILYGNEDNDPRLPSLRALSSFIRRWNRLIITDHGDGTWTAETNEEGILVMLDETTFEITSDTAVFIDPPPDDAYEISSSDKNEEDL